MIAIKGGNFNTRLQALSIYTEGGTEVSPSLYSVEESTQYTGQVTSIVEITILEEHSLQPGDEVLIESGGQDIENFVDGVSGSIITLVERLPLDDGIDVSIRNGYNTVTLDSQIDVGTYYISPINERLTIALSFNNPQISISDLAGEYHDAIAISRGRLPILIRQAKSRVISDLGGNNKIYHYLHSDLYRQLVIMAAVAMEFRKRPELMDAYVKKVEYAYVEISGARDPITGSITNEAKTNYGDWGFF